MRWTGDPRALDPDPKVVRLLETMLAEIRKLNASLSPPGKLLSKREAARRLGVSRARTLDGLIQEGRLRAVAVGGRLKIPASEIERLASESPPERDRRSVRATVPGEATKARRAAQVAEALKRYGF